MPERVLAKGSLMHNMKNDLHNGYQKKKLQQQPRQKRFRKDQQLKLSAPGDLDSTSPASNAGKYDLLCPDLGQN
jgi:hypothetical protein